MTDRYDCVGLFSGGLDSILAAKVIQDQGLSVLGLHFTSPFFGHGKRLRYWRKIYGVELAAVDVGADYIEMMRSGPRFGYGKTMNPCVDCKILMLRKARELMAGHGASFIITGEVLGQRPMSQRRDALAAIRRDAEVADVLLRPLCALKLDPTPMEESGLVDRERLLDLGGRGRKEQLRMAREYGITDIPAPGGGCRLTEIESAKRYVPVFENKDDPEPGDFSLANHGRQYWSGSHWLSIGRNRKSNERLGERVKDTDMTFVLVDHPSPLTVGRPVAGQWSADAVRGAASFAASFSPKAVRAGGSVRVAVEQAGERQVVEVVPDRDGGMKFKEPGKDGLAEWKKQFAK